MVCMPGKGQASITISEAVYKIAANKADKEKRSVANYLTKLILEDNGK